MVTFSTWHIIDTFIDRFGENCARALCLTAVKSGIRLTTVSLPSMVIYGPVVCEYSFFVVQLYLTPLFLAIAFSFRYFVEIPRNSRLAMYFGDLCTSSQRISVKAAVTLVSEITPPSWFKDSVVVSATRSRTQWRHLNCETNSFPEPTCLLVSSVSWRWPKDTWALGTKLLVRTNYNTTCCVVSVFKMVGTSTDCCTR